MDSEQWRMRLFPIETRPAWAKELVSDLAESEREAGVLRDALAESERLRAKAEDDRNQWRSACADETNRAARAEAKVAAWTKCVAQSSTQYREMVKVLTDARGMAHRHYVEDGCDECRFLIGSIDAVLGRSTP